MNGENMMELHREWQFLNTLAGGGVRAIVLAVRPNCAHCVLAQLNSGFWLLGTCLVFRVVYHASMIAYCIIYWAASNKNSENSSL